MNSYDRNLILQNVQRRYVRIRVLTKEWFPKGDITGRCTSGSISIDSSSNIRRTASLTLVYDNDSRDTINDLAINNYIQLYCGIEDNDTSEVMWYSEGVFIISDGGIKVSQTDRSISLNLSDMMVDLTGDRAGVLHAYTTKAQYSQRIDDVIVEVLKLGNIPYYSVCQIHPNGDPYYYIKEYDKTKDIGGPTKIKTEIDGKTYYKYEYTTCGDDAVIRTYLDKRYFGIPYEMKFEVGVSCYDILSKLVGLYPYYEMYFASNGTFVCKPTETENYNDMVLVDDELMKEVTISDDITINWAEVKNRIEVWGKDGKSYGEAYDTKGDSLFREDAVGTRRLVISSSEYGVNTENICDRYGDAEAANEMLKKQAEAAVRLDNAKLEYNQAAKIADEAAMKEAQAKIDVANQLYDYYGSELSKLVVLSGNILAKQWAEFMLWKKCRLQDKITITTILMPSLNEVGFKLGYRSKSDGQYKTWYVTGIQHDIAANTTTLTASLFDESMTARFMMQLATPVITSATAEDNGITVSVNAVPYAETYELYINDIFVSSSSSATIPYNFSSDSADGTYTVKVAATAEGFLRSELSEAETVTFTRKYYIIDENGNHITAENGDKLIFQR